MSKSGLQRAAPPRRSRNDHRGSGEAWPDGRAALAEDRGCGGGDRARHAQLPLHRAPRRPRRSALRVAKAADAPLRLALALLRFAALRAMHEPAFADTAEVQQSRPWAS